MKLHEVIMEENRKRSGKKKQFPEYKRLKNLVKNLGKNPDEDDLKAALQEVDELFREFDVNKYTKEEEKGLKNGYAAVWTKYEKTYTENENKNLKTLELAQNMMREFLAIKKRELKATKDPYYVMT